jgi:2-dehydropantoate 2-reductase
MTAEQIRTVAVVGAGAMGAMYAAHLDRAGIDTWLVARGSRAERLRSPGLTVNEEPLTAEVVDPHEIADGRRADLVLLAVKHQELTEALEDVAPLVDERTTFLSVLNGLDSERIVAGRFGAERVLLAIALAMDAQREGTRVFFRQAGRLKLGTGAGLGTDERLRAVQDLLDRAGLDWESPADMRREMWWKFLVNTSTNPPSGVLRAPYADFQQDGPARSLMLALIDEIVTVARAEGVELGPADVAAWEDVLSRQNPEGYTSTAQDVIAGRPTEVDIFSGRVVELGRKHGIDVPYNQTMLWLLA